MPTYEYACKSCRQRTEAVQAFTDPPLTTCPSCGGALRKVFGNVGISFKGAGFYKTDSRGSGAPKGDKVEAGADGTGGSDKVGDATADTAGKSDKTDGATPAPPSKATGDAGGKGGKDPSPKSDGSSGSSSDRSRNGATGHSPSRSAPSKTA